MEIISHPKIEGVFEISLNPKGDHRGFFMRTYDAKIFQQHNLNKEWVQENHSFSKEKGIVRGMHFQFSPFAEAKLVRVTNGRVYAIFVDIRKNSSTFGKWDSTTLSEENKKMLYLPRGFAMGICTLTPDCTLLYKMDNYYSPENQGEIKWDDPNLGIKWPITNPIISERDQKAMSFNEFVEKYRGIDV